MFLKNVISGFFLQILLVILGLISSVIVAREFGTEGQGYIAYLMLFITIISNFGHLGMLDVIPFFRNINKDLTIEKIYKTSITFVSLLSIILLIVGFCFNKFNLFFTEYNIKTVIIAIMIIFTNLLIGVQKGIFIEKELVFKFNKISSYVNLIKILILSIMYILMYLKLDSYFILLLVSNIIQFYINFKTLKLKASFEFDIDLIGKQLKLGFFVFLGALFIYLTYKSDQFFINHYLGKKDLGIFFIAVSIAELSFIVPQSVTNALIGKLVNNKETKKEIVSKTIKYSLIISFVITCIGCLSSPLISVFYGSDYKEAEIIFIYLLIGNVFATIGKISAPLAVSDNQAHFHVTISGISLMINIMLNIILIPHFGIKGAAIASLISYILYGILYFIYLVKIQKIEMHNFFVISNKEKEFFTLKLKKWSKRNVN